MRGAWAKLCAPFVYAACSGRRCRQPIYAGVWLIKKRGGKGERASASDNRPVRCGKSVPVFCRLRQHGRFDAGRRGAFKAGAQEDPLRELDFFLSSEQARFDGYCTAMRHAGYTVQAEDLLSHRDMDRLVVHKSIKNGQ